MGALALGQLLRTSGFVIAVILLSAITVHPSFATGSLSNEELRTAIAALEARVAALEGRLQRYEGTAEQQASTGTPKPLLVSLAADPPQYNPMQLGGSGGKLSEHPVDHGWNGLYWGTSFGYGSAFSKSRYRELRKSSDQWINDETGTEIGDDGSTVTNIDFSDVIISTVSTATGSSEGTDQTDGVLADLYLGASALLTPRVVAGFQIEGSLSEMTFGSSVGKEKVKFNTTETDTFRDSSSDGESDLQSDTATEGAELDRRCSLNYMNIFGDRGASKANAGSPRNYRLATEGM